MDEAETADYVVPCLVCSAVNWAISADLKYYCKSCHNVIDKTAEVDDHSFMEHANIVTDLATFRQRRIVEHGRKWNVCEGFQFILKHQAEALIRLGVPPEFKDVICHLWRLYLQKSRLAYTKNPLGSRVPRRARAADSSPSENNPATPSTSQASGPSAEETDGPSANETEGPSASETDAGPSSSDMEGTSADEGRPKRHKQYQSGSEDSLAFLSTHARRCNGLMSMTKTLALLYLGLLWCREALTLADLLRLVRDKHLPFINAFECLPEEMKLFGRDVAIFKVQSVPSYLAVHQEACSLARYMRLPSFPTVGSQCLQHPALLTLRYLVLLNLPDQLHPWVCRVIQLAGLDEMSALTFDPRGQAPLPFYDVQAAALLVVTLKLLFGVDDRREWELSSDAHDKNKADPDQKNFSIRQWYRLLQVALVRARRREEDHTARTQWMAQKPIYPSWKKKASFVKKQRMADQLRTAFTRLNGTPAEPRHPPPSSFRFRWGGEEGEEGGEGGEGAGWDGPSLRHKVLDSVVEKQLGGETPVNEAYWHQALKKCNRTCWSHFKEDKPTLPSMYCWLLELLSFLLGVKEALLHQEVVRVEHLLVPRPRRLWRSQDGPGTGGRPRSRRGAGGTRRAVRNSGTRRGNPASRAGRKKVKP